MTFSVFTSCLRWAVLFGLCLASTVHAAAVCLTNNQPNTTATSTQASCQAFVDYNNSQNNYTFLVSSTATTCYTKKPQNGQLSGTTFYFYEYAISCSCELSSTSGNYIVGRGIAGTADAASAAAIFDTKPLPNPQCVDGCVKTFESAGNAFIGDPTKVLFTDYETWFNHNFKPTKFNYSGASCVMPPTCGVGTIAGINGTCEPDLDYCPPPNIKDAAGICRPPLPVCTPPQVLNQNKICETPMCPVGQVRETSFSACKPIFCTPPLVKEGNFCVMPKCPAGETYEFTNGSGQCMKNDPVCTPPQTLVNGICKTPTCATGMILSLSGSCIPDPNINPNTKGSAGQPGTGTGATGTGTGTTGTSGGGGGAEPTATGGTTGTATGGTSGSGGGTGGASTNTSGTGLCTTPPCGDCDPATATCGDTFGGSCKSGFQCNGDAIQCAVAQATNKAECDLKSIYVDTEVDPAFIEGKSVFETGTKALGTQGGLQVTSGGAISINSTNPFAASCPADMQLFEYKGTSYVFPFSKYCNIFQIMGAIMLLIASVISMKIIMKQE